MKYKIEKAVNNLIGIFGLKMVSKKGLTKDMDLEKEFEEIYQKCKKYTKTSKERMFALYKSVEYVVNSGIEGDFVECGVWKGGSCMLIAYALLVLGVKDRKIWLYDTFEGMTKPTGRDIKIHGGKTANEMWKERKGKWDYIELEEVKKNMKLSGYPEKNLIFVKGKVEETIPKKIPKKITLLRLDTDFYESTYHELKHLYPLLSINGILILDDYGHWKGAKEAVDEYFRANEIKIFLNRIDKTGRIGLRVK